MMKGQDVTDTQTQPFIVKDYALTRLGTYVHSTYNLKMPDSSRQPEREERFHNYIRVSAKQYMRFISTMIMKFSALTLVVIYSRES